MAGFFVGQTMIDLTPDCENCAALCCVALAFDKGNMFAFDKPAGVACPHLSGHLCGIHAKLESSGLKGCVQYQCDGAGQRVVQDVFHGQSWQEQPTLLPAMLDAFSQMRQVHSLLALLNTARELPLPPQVQSSLESHINSLSQAEWTAESLTAFERSDLPKTVSAFLRGLKEFVPK